MTSERWHQIEALYHAVRARPAEARAAFLHQACEGDAALQREVESLLAQPVSVPGMLDRPAAEAAHLADGSAIGGGLAGRRLGAFQFQALIGAGGMGEVYRARDTKLGRDVAIKILPRAFTNNPDRLARFEREARVLASLNHPNIAAIYGLEDVDPSTGSGQALVLELVEGETLADHIRRGPVPLAEALSIARQIADALDAAHERGIVHRDLKPANIAIRSDGAVKILDFGLAKALSGDDGSRLDLSALPTMGTAGTREGLAVGTPTYMSPEQARGQAVDKRTDIWAFGCVLYEMLAGRAAFPGETISDTIAAVLDREPDWNALPATLSDAVRRLLRRSLEKDRKRRLSDIADARLEIDEALTTPGEGVATQRPVVASKSGRFGRVGPAWTLAAAFLALGGTLAVGALTYFNREPIETPPLRFFVSPPDGWRLNTVLSRSVASTAPLTISPDGRFLAFLARNADGRSQIWIRALDTLATRALPGTEDAASPFWSPDSGWLGFFAQGLFKKIDVAGGPPVTICEAADNRGGTWSRDGVIVFAPDHDAPLQRVSAAGGVPAAATALGSGESGHERPSFLPDGRHFLYNADGKGGPVFVASLDSADRTTLLAATDSSNVAYADGYLLYLRGTTLMAQPFDATRRALNGDAVPIAEEIQTQGTFGVVGDFGVSQTGVMVYQTGTGEHFGLQWFDRAGKRLGTLGEPGNQAFLELSPDGMRAAVSIVDHANNDTRDIWLYDVARGLRTRLTSDPHNDTGPIWSADGSRIVFTSNRGGTEDLYQKDTSGTAPEQSLPPSDLSEMVTSWSPDGRHLLVQAPAPGNGLTDVWVWALGEGGKPMPFIQTPFGDRRAKFSPDGRWVTYESNESGKVDVWVTPFPRADRKWLISPAGGTWPRWRKDGREIFYLAPDSRLTAAEVNGHEPAFQVGQVRPLFQIHPASIGAPYDVSANGQRFLVNAVEEDPMPTPITVVVNWTAGLKKQSD